MHPYLAVGVGHNLNMLWFAAPAADPAAQQHPAILQGEQHMAMTPQQLGIGLRRHFTTKGTHAYDEVAWETRDARIPNYKDGGDAFFQPGVEFPTSWSLNATNIVAQKYFRGTLGTPEREHSLRQVIDRVADTITEWGRRDGYFVDDEET